jgi:hypothetical protein
VAIVSLLSALPENQNKRVEEKQLDDGIGDTFFAFFRPGEAAGRMIRNRQLRYNSVEFMID